MLTDYQVNTPKDERPPIEQAGTPVELPVEPPPVEPPSAAAPEAVQPPVELPVEPPQAVPPPTPPRGRLAARVQQMSLGWRWALGLVLAFLSGVAFLLSPNLGGGGIPYVGTALGFVVLFVLALAAGFVLSNWWAALALVVAAVVGDFAGGWLYTLVLPAGTVEGLTGLGAALVAFLFLAPVTVPSLILFLLGGVGLGKHYGITIGQPHAQSTGEVSVSRWIAVLAPVIGAGYLAPPVGYMPGAQLGPEFTVSMILYAVALAATCLLAGWLLSSWWGFVLAPVVYASVAVLATLLLPWFGYSGDMQVWTTGFLLYIVLPAVVMSAIGTAIGMYRAGRWGHHPHSAQPAI